MIKFLNPFVRNWISTFILIRWNLVSYQPCFYVITRRQNRKAPSDTIYAHRFDLSFTFENSNSDGREEARQIEGQVCFDDRGLTSQWLRDARFVGNVRLGLVTVENGRLVWRSWLRNGDRMMCEEDSCPEDLNAMVTMTSTRLFGEKLFQIVETQFHVIGIKGSSLCVGFALNILNLNVDDLIEKKIFRHQCHTVTSARP